MNVSTLDRASRILLLSVLLAFSGAHVAHAADARAETSTQTIPVQQESQGGLIHRLSTRLYNAFTKLAHKVATRLTAMEDVELTIVSIERDDRNRMYVDLEGEVELKFPKMARRLEKYMDDLTGHHVMSDGPMNLDFTVLAVEKTGDNSYHVEFKAKVIVVLEEVLTKLVKFSAGVVGTVTLMGIGSDLAAIMEGVDAPMLGEHLGRGMKDMTKVLASLAGVEAYDAYRGFRADRDSIGQGHSSAGSVMIHLGITVMHGMLRVGTSIVGMSMGAALGTALFPGAGSTIGAIAGAAAFTLVGNLVYSKLTVDLPVYYRLSRIRRMAQRAEGYEAGSFRDFLVAKIEKQEIKMLKRFSLEMRTDKFDYLDEILQQVRKHPEYKPYWQGIRRKIEEKLRFEVVNRQDKLFAWKLDQVKESFDRKR